MTALILAIGLASIPVVQAPKGTASPPIVSPKIDTVKTDTGGTK